MIVIFVVIDYMEKFSVFIWIEVSWVGIVEFGSVLCFEWFFEFFGISVLG